MPAPEFKIGFYGNELHFKLPWRKECDDILNANKIDHIQLDANVVRGRDTEFLRRVPDLNSFSVLCRKGIDLSGLRHIRRLAKLVLTGCSVYQNLDKANLNNIERLGIDAKNNGGEDWFLGLQNLKELYCMSYPDRDLVRLVSRDKLEVLSVSQGKLRSLDGIETMKHLHTLDLYGMRSLTSIRGIENLKALRKVELGSCRKIDSLIPLLQNIYVEDIQLENTTNIRSLRDFKDIDRLKRLVLLEGLGVEDGDMSYLLHAKKLEWVGYVNKRHYSHRDFEIRAARNL